MSYYTVAYFLISSILGGYILLTMGALMDKPLYLMVFLLLYAHAMSLIRHEIGLDTGQRLYIRYGIDIGALLVVAGVMTFAEISELKWAHLAIGVITSMLLNALLLWPWKRRNVEEQAR